MMELLSQMMMALMGLVLVTNLVVEVLKKALPISTNLIALVVAEALTLLYGGIMAAIHLIPITWYLVAGSVVIGLLVAYGAMFGWDKLQQTLNQIRGGGNGDS